MKLSTLLALAALVALFIWSQRVLERPAPKGTVTEGRGRAVDGDSLTLDGQAIRLQGIDAPEFSQVCTGADGKPYNCGRTAAAALRRLLSEGPLSCSGYEFDRYNRMLGTCHVGGRNIAAELVREGLAVSYGDYYVEEAKARNEKKGLWAGDFDNPRDWRRTHERFEGAPPRNTPTPPANKPLQPVGTPVPPPRPQ